MNAKFYLNDELFHEENLTMSNSLNDKLCLFLNKIKRVTATRVKSKFTIKSDDADALRIAYATIQNLFRS